MNEKIPQEDFMRSAVLTGAMALILAACSNDTDTAPDTAAVSDAMTDAGASAEANTAASTEMDTGASATETEAAMEEPPADTTLADAINHERRDENRGRDEWRNPMETLSFFGIEPDMTIVEVLPGNGGWYSQILTPLTAERGRLIGATYPQSLFEQMFGTWNEDSVERIGADIAEMGRYLSVEGVESAQPIVGYAIDNIPDAENGQADAVLFVRALHHLFRFDEPIIDMALAETYDVLASGGVAGVVQHRAPEDADAGFANGDNGYLKQSDVVAAFERAGFALEEASEINANPADLADGFVWRLPPTTTDNPDTAAIGESDRMTLRFRKP